MSRINKTTDRAVAASAARVLDPPGDPQPRKTRAIGSESSGDPKPSKPTKPTKRKSRAKTPKRVANDASRMVDPKPMPGKSDSCTTDQIEFCARLLIGLSDEDFEEIKVFSHALAEMNGSVRERDIKQLIADLAEVLEDKVSPQAVDPVSFDG